jgi:catechol 2,3-dioxygenase
MPGAIDAWRGSITISSIAYRVEMKGTAYKAALYWASYHPYIIIGDHKNVELYRMQEKYTIPAGTRIGHIHLKVSDLEKALSFYRDLLGFEVMQHYGDSAVFVSAGGYHHHIGLNTWHSKIAGPAPANAAGLYHTAILYPTRKDLAIALKRLIEAKYPLNGASDHGVSEAIYLDDPDGNGVELYWDKPREDWPFDSNGKLQMITARLDVQALLAEAG